MKTCCNCGTEYNLIKRKGEYICHFCLYEISKKETNDLIKNSKNLQKQHQRMLKIKNILYGN
jgi:uncharacterized Zn finger protein (UPF0148 family)